MEKYLRRCLDSLLIDEEGMKQLEVLVINDGSKDSSSSIAHEYQDKYPDTYRVIDKENGNYGSCINRGLKEATGKYVKILDADDWFETENLSKYLIYLEKHDDDLILNNCIKKGKSNNIIGKFEINGIESSQQFGFEILYRKKIFPQMHCVAYKTELLHKMNYVQTEGISYTDQEWVSKPMVMINKFSSSGLDLYNYCIEREGQTMEKAIMEKNFKNQVIVASSIVMFTEKYEGDKIHTQYIIEKSISFLDYLYRTHFFDGYFSKDEIIEFDSHINKVSKKIYKILLNKKTYIRFWKSNHLLFLICIYWEKFKMLIKR